MPISVNTTTPVLSTAIEPMVTGIIDIIGQGSNGYGLVNYSTFPVTPRTRILADQVFGIYQDLQTIHEHVTGTTSSTVITIQTGSIANIRVIRPPVTNLVDTTTWQDLVGLYDIVAPQRYQLAPSQRSTYTNALGQIDSLFMNDTTSTNTGSWGLGSLNQDIQIKHRVLFKWGTADLAKYFFNTGGEIQLRTSQNGLFGGLTPSKPIDRAWAQFLSSSTVLSQFKYNRNNFIAASPTGAFSTQTSSATISIIVNSQRLADGTGVELTANYNVRVGGWIIYDDAITAGSGTAQLPGSNTNSPSNSKGGSSTPWWVIGAVAVLKFFGFSAICAKLGELGLMDQDLLKGDALFAAKLAKTRPEAIRGYHAWAWWVITWMDGHGPKIPLISRSRLTKWARSWSVAIATPVAEEMSYRAGHGSGRTTWAGRVILDTALWACSRLGKNIPDNHRFEFGPGKLALVLILACVARVMVTLNSKHKIEDSHMIFNTTQEEFYQRWQSLSESDRQRLWQGLSIDALMVVKQLFPEEPVIDQLIDFKRSE